MTDPDTTPIPIEDRARARAATLRQQAEQIRVAAEKQITALLTAADELDALLTPPQEAPDAP